MTLFYDTDENAIVENHPEEWVEFDDDGRLVIKFDDAPDERKVRVLLNAAADAVDASDDYELTTEPETKWIGGD